MGRVIAFSDRQVAHEGDSNPAGRADSVQDRSQRVTELFEAHNRALVRFLTCRLKSVEEAKEVAQEAYARMLQLDAPDGVSYLRAFLFKTASNLAADRLKSAARRERIQQLKFFDDRDVAPSPECEVAAEQELATVLRVIDELPAKCRYAFLMNRFHGRELVEIAQSLGISERMVRIYMERAIVFCRERLLKTGGPGG
jgi:RNA polymerase sigma factor (sigma-70 family)